MARGTYPCKAPDLLANPPNSVRNAFHTLYDGDQEAVRDLHEHRQPRCNDGLHVVVGSCNLWRDTAREVWREGACLFLDLRNHLFVDFDRIDLQVKVLVLDKAVDAFCEHTLEVALTRPTSCVGCHHTGYGRVRAKEGSKLRRCLELR